MNEGNGAIWDLGFGIWGNTNCRESEEFSVSVIFPQGLPGKIFRKCGIIPMLGSVMRNDEIFRGSRKVGRFVNISIWRARMRSGPKSGDFD